MAASVNASAGQDAMSGPPRANHNVAPAGDIGRRQGRYISELKLLVDNGLGLSNFQLHRNAIDHIAGLESQYNLVHRDVWLKPVRYGQARLRPVQDEVNVVIGRVAALAVGGPSNDDNQSWPHDDQAQRLNSTGINAAEDILSLMVMSENQARSTLAALTLEWRLKDFTRAKAVTVLNERLASINRAK